MIYIFDGLYIVISALEVTSGEVPARDLSATSLLETFSQAHHITTVEALSTHSMHLEACS
jgi:hypothetical protein